MIEETAPEEPVPFMNARYQDLGAFARGGYSVIHLVREHGLDRSVAMKVMQEGIREQVDARERFCKEARITAQLDHPGIVPIHELGPWWFTMKRIEGLDLPLLCPGQHLGRRRALRGDGGAPEDLRHARVRARPEGDPLRPEA